METRSGGNLYWFALAMLDKDIKTMLRKGCWFNRYPGMEKLC